MERLKKAALGTMLLVKPGRGSQAALRRSSLALGMRCAGSQAGIALCSALLYSRRLQ